MTSITILLWAVIVRLYYRSTRTTDIEPAGTIPISIRRSDRPPSPNLLPMTVMLPSSQLQLSMMDTIKEEVQEAMLRERMKTALIVRGVPEKGKDQEEISNT